MRSGKAITIPRFGCFTYTAPLININVDLPFNQLSIQKGCNKSKIKEQITKKTCIYCLKILRPRKKNKIGNLL